MIVNNPQAKSKTQYGMCYRGRREKREPLLVAQNPSLPFYNGKKQMKIQSNPKTTIFNISEVNIYFIQIAQQVSVCFKT